jgi:hypothetical protein
MPETGHNPWAFESMPILSLGVHPLAYTPSFKIKPQGNHSRITVDCHTHTHTHTSLLQVSCT